MVGTGATVRFTATVCGLLDAFASSTVMLPVYVLAPRPALSTETVTSTEAPGASDPNTG